MGVVSSSNDLPLERSGVEGAPSTNFFLFSSLPAPLGPMAWAKKPSVASQKLRKRFFWRGAPSQPPQLRRGGVSSDLPRPCKGSSIAPQAVGERFPPPHHPIQAR